MSNIISKYYIININTLPIGIYIHIKQIHICIHNTINNMSYFYITYNNNSLFRYLNNSRNNSLKCNQIIMLINKVFKHNNCNTTCFFSLLRKIEMGSALLIARGSL